MRFLFASITGPLVNWVTHVIGTLGYAGVVVMMASSGVIGVPGTEPTMLFAGFNVYQGRFTLLGAIVFGVLGDMLGTSIAYAIGYYGRHGLLDRQGSKLHVSAKRLDRAHRWFERWGSPVIFVSRFIPFLRAVFPYAAGVAEMPFVRFFVLALLGSIGWVTGLALLGRQVGHDWQNWRHHLEYADYAAIAIAVLVIAYLILRRTRSGRQRAAVDAVPK